MWGLGEHLPSDKLPEPPWQTVPLLTRQPPPGARGNMPGKVAPGLEEPPLWTISETPSLGLCSGSGSDVPPDGEEGR